MLNTNTTTASDNTEDRTVIFTSSYDVLVSDDGTLSWNSNDAGALNLFKAIAFAARLADRLSRSGRNGLGDISRLVREVARNADVRLRKEKLELEDGYAFRSVGEITCYSDGHFQVRGSQCGRVNIFSLSTRIAGLVCKLHNMARQ